MAILDDVSIKFVQQITIIYAMFYAVYSENEYTKCLYKKKEISFSTQISIYILCDAIDVKKPKGDVKTKHGKKNKLSKRFCRY